MSLYGRNPLFHLGYDDERDYYTFRNRLRVPLPYLWYIFKKHNKTLFHVPADLGNCCKEFNELMRRKRMTSGTVEQQFRVQQLTKVGVPALYIGDTSEAEGENVSSKAFYKAMLDRPEKLAKAGMTLYMHSEQGTSSVKAASQVCESLVKSKHSVYMIDFTSIMAEVKDFDKKNKTLLKTVDSADLLVIYFIGTEYSTKFTTSHMDSIIKKRQIQGRTTILCSHLSPSEFEGRYQKKIDFYDATAVRFKDEKIKKTLKSLTDLLLEG